MSVAAIFLALAIGLVVGTAAANGPIVDNLKGQVVKLANEKQQLRDELDQERTELQESDNFATESASRLLAGALTGKHVLVVDLQGDDGRVDRAAEVVVERLRLADANLTGRVTVKSGFLAPAANDELLELATSAAPSSIADALPGGVDGVDRTGAVLAALLTGGPGAPRVDGARAVFDAYKEFLTAEGAFSAPAEGVVVVAGPPPAGKDASELIARAQTLVTRFQRAGAKVVVAGLSAPGLVSAVRGDATLAKSLSTVDNASTAKGQVATVLVVSDLFRGKVNHCGSGEGVTGLLPQ